MTTPSFDRASIAAHVGLIHQLAAGIQGVIPLFSVEEGKAPKVQRFGVGNVADTVGAIMAFENRQSLNVYHAVGGHAARPGTKSQGQRGRRCRRARGGGGPRS